MSRQRISIAERTYATASAFAFIKGQRRSRVIEDAIDEAVRRLGREERRRLKTALAARLQPEAHDDGAE